MRQYEQSELDQLISCQKAIVDLEYTELTEDRGSMKNGISLLSADGRFKFRVFMRISKEFSENFSIGLDLLADDGSRVNLLRCNGAHEGVNLNPTHSIGNHSGFHIHYTKADDLNRGKGPWRHVEKTDKFASFDEGLRHFFLICNVSNPTKFFPELNQIKLFP